MKGHTMLARKLLLIAIALYIMSSLALADNFKRKSLRKRLEGVQQVQVLVERLPEVLQEAGLSQDRIQTDVELKLRTAGIRMVSHSQCFLYVNVNGGKFFPDHPVGYYYYCSVSFDQPVILLRQAKLLIGAKTTQQALHRSCFWAKTWDKNIIGLIGLDASPARKIRDTIRDLLDDFINDFLAAKQKKERRDRIADALLKGIERQRQQKQADKSKDKQ